LDQWTYLVDQNLLYMDKLSMAHSIESRVPFLDWQVYELASQIPSSQLVTKQKLKAILNESAAPLLPPSILNRPKSGFGILYLYDWWKSQKPDWFEDLLRAAITRGWYAPRAVLETRAQAERGNARASELLLSILLSEVWAQCFLERVYSPV
jgi:asparagine synthase (glutamine-hydrolysing)